MSIAEPGEKNLDVYVRLWSQRSSSSMTSSTLPEIEAASGVQEENTPVIGHSRIITWPSAEHRQVPKAGSEFIIVSDVWLVLLKLQSFLKTHSMPKSPNACELKSSNSTFTCTYVTCFIWVWVVFPVCSVKVLVPHLLISAHFLFCFRLKCFTCCIRAGHCPRSWHLTNSHFIFFRHFPSTTIHTSSTQVSTL